MTDAVGRRGATPVTAADLEAHLGLLLRTENVGVLLGAGASVPAGGPTMASLWKGFAEQHADAVGWFREHGFVGVDDATPNVELVLDRLAVAELDLNRRSADPTDERTELRRHRGTLYQSLLRACLLDEEYWSGGKDPASDSRLVDHRSLLAKLVSTRSPGQDAPWVFSTNYDLSIEWGAESLELEVINGFGGLHDRRFSSSRFDLGIRNVQASGLARLGSYHLYLVKLHGSLTWLRSEDDTVREVAMGHAWAELSGLLEDGADADDLSSRVMILPNTQKYLASAGHVHGELIRRFTEFLGRPQTTLLVAGYSFGDEHINRVIRGALHNPTLQLVVFLPELRADGDPYEAMSPVARSAVEPIAGSASPRVTFVHGDAALLQNLVVALPEPALLDEISVQTALIERRLASARPEEPASGDD